MKKLLPLLFPLLSLVCFGQEITIKTLNDSVFEVGDIIKMPVILFNLDGGLLDHPSNPKDSLNQVVRFMKKFPRLVLEINCHTDYRSDAKYNQKLSYNRAKACSSYMIYVKEVDTARIIPVGYGESMPVTLSKDIILPTGKVVLAGTKLTEQWIDKNVPMKKNRDDYETVMQQNRRTELKVLKTDYIPKVIFTLKGKVTDNMTKEPIAGATIKLVGSDNSSLEIKTDSSGNYSFDWTKINIGINYVVSASALNVKNKKTFNPYLGNPKAKISTYEKWHSHDFIQDFGLNQAIICIFGVPSVPFEKNSSSLEHATDSLDYLIKIMTENPNITIEVQCHASHDEKKPQVLSFNRAKAVVDYLISLKGIAPDRITPSAYSDSKPYVVQWDHTLPSGQIIPKGTELSKKWIKRNISKKKAPADYENIMKLNRRAAFLILRKDYVPKK